MPKASIIYPDTIVHRNNNGGWHKNGRRAYRNAVNTIHRCLPLYREARLYHLCFEALDEVVGIKTSKEMNKANREMLKALVQMAEREGIKCEWFAAREIADGTKKDHLHCFMLIDAYGIKVAKLFNQFEDGRVQQHCKAHGVKFAIFSPKDYEGIHGNNTYMALPYQGPGNKETELGRKRLADALVWCSYLGKARSKPEDNKDGQIFPASRPGRKKNNPLPPIAALPAAKEETTQTESKERNEGQFATSYEAGNGSESIAAGGSIEASTESTAMVGTGCESIEARATTSSTKAEDQWQRRIGRTDTADEEVNLVDLIGRFPLRFPVGKGWNSQIGWSAREQSKTHQFRPFHALEFACQ
ncbi:MAG: hypothetical protein ACRYF7_03280 [Janthinobacterium lividum]